MRRFWLGSVALFALGVFALGAGPASAADLAARPYTKAPPPIAPPIYDWSGFYIGVNGGGGSARHCWDLVGVPAGPVVPGLAQGCHDATGGTAGGQIGYRWQYMSNWVFGLEAQGNWADFKGSNLNLLAGGIFLPGVFDESKIEAFGLFTGQIGYAWNNVLFYVKGGGAVTDEKYHTFLPGGVIVDSANSTRWGGTVGAGFEYGFAPGWSVGVEYDHLFMGHRNIDAITPLGVFSATDRIRSDVDIGLVRFNYHFAPSPVIAKY